MHVDLEVEQAKVTAGIVSHVNAAVDLEGAGHDKGRVATLICDQSMKGDVIRGLFSAEDRATCKGGTSLQRESTRCPDRDEIRFQRNVCLLFISAAALAGNSQPDNSHQGGTDQGLPYQFPQFYGAQI